MTGEALAGPLEEAFRQASELDAPLDARLGMIRDAVAVLGGPAALAVERLVARLEAAGAGAAAPRPGEPLPPFLLPDETGRLVGLPDLLADGPVVVAFQRGHWCPYCRLSAAALARAEQPLAALGARAVVITPDRPRFAAQLKAEAGGGFPVLTDTDNGYARSLNLVISVGAEMAGVLARSGRDLAAFQGNDAWLLPVPATFVVGRDGIILARHVDPDYRRRMDTDQLLAAVRSARGG